MFTVVPVVLKALAYDERRGAHSVGELCVYIIPGRCSTIFYKFLPMNLATVNPNPSVMYS